MLNESPPECFQDKILRKVNFFLKRFNTISTKIIIGYIPAFESEVKKYFSENSKSCTEANEKYVAIEK